MLLLLIKPIFSRNLQMFMDDLMDISSLSISFYFTTTCAVPSIS